MKASFSAGKAAAPDGMLEAVLTTISRYNMLAPGHRLIAAVSGGPDSMCLLEVLRRLGWQADAYLPNRMDEGYGLSRDGVENCLKKNALRPDAVLESVLESLEVNLGIEFGKRVR